MEAFKQNVCAKEVVAMRHRRTALACLMVPTCLLAGCRAAGGTPSANDQSPAALSSIASLSPLAGEPDDEPSSNSSAEAPPWSSNGSAPGQALDGTWVLQQVETVDGRIQRAHPGQTTLSIRTGTLFAVDACSQQLQAQVKIDSTTIKLNGGIAGGGFGGGRSHPCGDPDAVGFWDVIGNVQWEIVHSQLIVHNDFLTLTYKKG